MSEKEIQNQVFLAIGALPYCRVWRCNTGRAISMDGSRIIAFGVPGMADIMGIMQGGLVLAFEIKTRQGRLSEQQRKFGQMIEQFGGVYRVITSPEQAVDIVRQIAADRGVS